MGEATNVTYDFSGEVVLITGAARGQGRSHALAFAAAGADLVLADICAPVEAVPYPLGTAEELEEVAAEARALGVRCETAVCDVRDRAQVRAMVEQAIGAFGKVDVLINNAAVESLPPVVEMSEEAWDAVLDTALKGTFLCSQAVAAHMVDARKGRIITTGSTASKVGMPLQTHYCAAKHGVVGFTKALAIELAEFGITANVVAPGGIDTEMTHGLLASPEGAGMKRMGAAGGPFNLFDPTAMLASQEITNAMLWLASDAARFVTGSTVTVDAGHTIK
jgi:NAD(P)-dependent dehydrogenase (short-subunit alcohol dehydrogenase family)